MNTLYDFEVKQKNAFNWIFKNEIFIILLNNFFCSSTNNIIDISADEAEIN